MDLGGLPYDGYISGAQTPRTLPPGFTPPGMSNGPDAASDPNAPAGGAGSGLGAFAAGGLGGGGPMGSMGAGAGPGGAGTLGGGAGTLGAGGARGADGAGGPLLSRRQAQRERSGAASACAGTGLAVLLAAGALLL
jgi:hypothetical protein